MHPAAFACSLFTVTAAVVIGGCDRDETTAPTSNDDVYVVDPDDPASGEASTGSGAAGADANAESSADGEIIRFDGLTAEVPEDWVREPSSGMRAVQMRVPAVEDSSDASVVVFSGISGPVEANVERWRGQFSDEQGQSPQAQIEEMTVGDLKITTATLSGIFDGGMMNEYPGAGTMMVQSIVEHPGGQQTFIRLLGPEVTVVAHRENFDAMLRSLR